MKTKTLLPDLKSKYADKSWNGTVQLVRRLFFLKKTKGVCEPFAQCLQKINEALSVSFLTAVVSRLEMIAKQRGFELFLHTDIALRSQHPILCYALILDNHKMVIAFLQDEEFSRVLSKLDDLASFYIIPGDSDVKINIHASLRHLETDLFKISHLPRSLRESDLHVDIMNGRIGNVQPGKEGAPLTAEYYISPLDLLIRPSNTGIKTVARHITSNPSSVSHDLQKSMRSSFFVCSRFPVFQPLTESCSELLPATFLLKLQPPLPMLMSFIEKMGNVTDGVIAEKPQQVEPLPQLLMKTSKTLCSKTSWTDGVQFVVPLPASEYHSYVFPGAIWGRESWKVALIHTVPFTHPSQVPASLDLLRHQSAINLLLASCFSNHSQLIDAGLLYDLRCEILPESDHCLSVTFSLDDNIHLAVLQVTVLDSHQMSCRLLMPDFVDHKLDDYISRVLMRCMSIPITRRAISVPGHIVHDLSCTCCMYFKEKKYLSSLFTESQNSLYY
uniref:Mediator of RNA polymerase II transcription subunit 1 n=1 Tax=Sinocyclocheilus anshuiensis TaxID=1608454 RepID=A0A671MEE6_9TELE